MLKMKLLPMLLPLCILVVSGCSELHVLGKATVRELSSEAISVEQASYRPLEQSAEPQKTKVAKASPPASPVKTSVKEKKEKKKGLWEH